MGHIPCPRAQLSLIEPLLQGRELIAELVRESLSKLGKVLFDERYLVLPGGSLADDEFREAVGSISSPSTLRSS